MSSITTTAQDAFREFCIRANHAGREINRRAREERGQTAAEYMGVLVVVAVIIAAVAGTEVRQNVRRRTLRRRPQQRRHPLREEVTRVLERFDRRPRRPLRHPPGSRKSSSAPVNGSRPTSRW